MGSRSLATTSDWLRICQEGNAQSSSVVVSARMPSPAHRSQFTFLAESALTTSRKETTGWRSCRREWGRAYIAFAASDCRNLMLWMDIRRIAVRLDFAEERIVRLPEKLLFRIRKNHELGGAS